MDQRPDCTFVDMEAGAQERGGKHGQDDPDSGRHGGLRFYSDPGMERQAVKPLRGQQKEQAGDKRKNDGDL